MNTKRYRVGPQGAYRDGTLYPQGSIIEVPDDGKPENQPSETWIPLDKVETKKDADGKEQPLETGAFTNAQRAENPNPLPPTPASSKSFQAQGQFIPKAENEKTVGELRMEKDGPKQTNMGAVKASTHDARVAAERADLEVRRSAGEKVTAADVAAETRTRHNDTKHK